PRVWHLALHRDLQGDRAGRALDGQVPADPVPVLPGLLGARDAIGHRGVERRLEEVRGLEVVVAPVHARADAGSVDGDLTGDMGEVVGFALDPAAERVEVAANGGDRQVPGD